jgi:cystine transport system substrate-binding protein
MNWFRSLIVAGAIQALAILPGHAGENLDAIKAAGVFKIGTEGT